ncbi:glycosyltransferase family 4 protein [Natronococcus wangiae]|uniref:glycosyltransferase family 4 protein n=1 Tax=Natronococcus wangiae TaxID=3068275 RepID=UPI00273D594F|nr:glycosyltransferase family 4 protein [Natronococcus sp. AD5]
MAGAHRWEQLVTHLPSGFDCRVVSPHPSVPVGEFDRSWELWKNERISGIPVTRLWTYQPVENRSNIERILNHVIFTVLATVYVVIHGRKYDCVVVQIGPHTTLVPGITAAFLGCGFVVDIYDLWLDNAASFGFVDEESLTYKVIERMERFALTRCDHIIALTPTMASQYRQKYGIDEEKFTSVPFGVDAALFDSSIDLEEQNRIIYTGKLGEGQAFEPYLRAFSTLETDCEFVIYGFGERRDELRALCRDLEIEDRVSIHGPVARTKIPELVAASTLSIVPLKTNETLDYARPTKLLETMAIGTPYVASNVAEIEFVSSESQAGIAVENDPEAVATAMRDLIVDSKKRRTMGKRGVEFIDENHRWEALGEEVGAVLSDVVHEPAPA